MRDSISKLSFALCVCVCARAGVCVCVCVRVYVCVYVCAYARVHLVILVAAGSALATWQVHGVCCCRLLKFESLRRLMHVYKIRQNQLPPLNRNLANLLPHPASVQFHLLNLQLWKPKSTYALTPSSWMNSRAHAYSPWARAMHQQNTYHPITKQCLQSLQSVKLTIRAQDSWTESLFHWLWGQNVPLELSS